MTTKTSTKTNNLSMKLLIDTKAKKVLFAEASKEVVDFLFTLLQLPLATVVKLLTKEDAVGCLGNLYSSVENLNHIYMQPNLSKDLLLNPTILGSSPSISGFLPSASGMITPKLYGCNNSNCNTISDVCYSRCPTCTTSYMSKEMTTYFKGRAATAANNNGFVKEVTTYMIMDDLLIQPMSAISSINMLNKQFNVKNVGILKDTVVQLGINEVSLFSIL
ncbi:uncharacterized protein LOC130950308 [Arachis stenosperma]|uniref:uncharacterized protein LOC130950308 n=1 Tax=Arachis stenosperma TaxID=217475 RepID=UPI0025AD61EC|nr:uncharacterized protein LOC130950308 [Arachis stenosperma]